MICAPKDCYLLSLDLSQAEAWVVAYKCNDPNMKDALKRGDIHSLTGAMVNDFKIPTDTDIIQYTKQLYLDGILSKDQRYIGKKSNHAFNYRMGPEMGAIQINKEGNISVSIKQVRGWHKRYHEFYMLQNWWSEIEDRLRENRTLTTVYGFRRVFYNQWGNELFKEATAFEPQSTIADHMLGAVQKEIGIEGGIRTIYKRIIKPSKGFIKAINTAHDSLILEVPKDRINEVSAECLGYLMRPIMINGETFTIPADSSYYPERWGENEVKLN